MGYYSAIEKNEIMPFVATWMEQEIIKPCEVRKINTYGITQMCNLKQGTDEFKDKIVTDSQSQRTNLGSLCSQRGMGRDGLGIWDQQMQTIVYYYIQNE